MATSKSQRLVNLVICLLSRSDYQSARQIRATVQGYEDSASDEAFARTFERDKAELEDAGVILEKGTSRDVDEAIGYRIRRDDVELPPLDLTPRAAGVLAVVGAVWAGAERNAELTGALNKLRAAGIQPELTAPVEGAAGDPRELEVAADLAEYAGTGNVVGFTHTPAGETVPAERSLEPWLVASREGHWYVVGYDRGREAVRSFRISRIANLRVHQDTVATHPRPSSSEVQAILDAAVSAFDATVSARIWVARDTAAELRACARQTTPQERNGVPGDLLDIPSASLVRLTRLVAGAGVHAVALEPAELVASVCTTLRTAAEAAS